MTRRKPSRKAAGEESTAAEDGDQSIVEDPSALRMIYAKAMDDIVRTSEIIKKRMDLLDAKEANWNKLKRKMQENADHATKKIKLDVGGKIFCIAKNHLLSVEGSYFHAMLASGHWKPDSDGTYFIDRNPKHFDRVLDYLRTGELSYDGMRPVQIKSFRNTLDYLQLGPPVSWDPNACGKGLILSDGNRTIRSIDQARAVRSLEPCVRFSIRLDAEGENAAVMIGFAPKAGFTPNAETCESCGWYLYASNGELFSQDDSYDEDQDEENQDGEDQDDASDEDYGADEVAVGSVVTCILDRENKTISFEVDGKTCGVAYTDIPDEEVYAALSFEGKPDIELTLVN